MRPTHDCPDWEHAGEEEASSSPTETVGAGSTEDVNKVVELRRVPATEVVTLCFEKASLATVLDTLSAVTGAAFDVAAVHSGKLSLTTKGTVEEIVSQISLLSGTSVTIAQ